MSTELMALLLLNGLAVSGCDPTRHINMKNLSNEECSIIWTLKEDSAKTSPFFISNDLEVKFNLKPVKSHNVANLSIGTGKWTDVMIKSIADDLESLTIVHKNDSLKLETESTISKYLQDRRKGITKTRIDIVLN